MNQPIAIVTGVTSGIGKASAIALGKKGYHIVGLGRSAEPNDMDGISMTYVRGDIADRDTRDRLVAAATAIGVPSVLVNVAGVAPEVRRDLLEMTEESYDRVMNINTKSVLFLTQAVVREMLKRDPALHFFFPAPRHAPVIIRAFTHLFLPSHPISR